MKKKPKNTETKSYRAKQRAKLARKALKLWFELGMLTKAGVCEVCGTKHGTLNGKGKPQWLNGHHIEDKANYALRFDPMNHVLLCPTCHKFGVTSAHRSPVWFVNWLSEHKPGVLGYILRNRLCGPTSLSDWTLEMIGDRVQILKTAIAHWKAVHGEG